MLDSPELSRLENDFSIAELLSRLGASVSRYKRRLFLTDCPGCGSDAWVLPTGIFCNAHACTFTSGGPLEYLAARMGRLGVAEAIEDLAELSSDRQHFWSATDPQMLRDALTQQVSARRSLFNFFISMGQRTDARGDVCLLAEHTEEWRRHLGSHQLSIFHAGCEDLKRLKRFFDGQRIDVKLSTRQPLVLIPFFEHHHSIAAIVTYCPENKRTNVLKLRPVEFSLSGLLDSSPAADRVYITGNPIKALQAGNRVSLFSEDESVLGLLYNPGGHGYAHLPERAVYCMPEDELPGFAAAYRKTSPETRFMLGVPPAKGGELPWWDFVKTRLLNELKENEGASSHDMLVFAQAADLSKIERHQIVHAVEVEGYVNAARRLGKTFSTRILLRQNNITLRETPRGYSVSRDGQILPEQVTNFTLSLEHNIIFEDSRDLFHSGSIVFQGETYPVVVSSDDLNSAVKFQERVQRAVMLQEETPDNLPIIRDRSLFKYVSLVLRENLSALKSKPGVAAFGWHHSRKKYTAPGWKLGMDGVMDGPFDYHPDRPILDYFRDGAFTLPTAAPATAPAGLADVARMVLAGVFREFCNMPMQGVPIRQNRKSQLAMEIVFKCLGQHRPINAVGAKPVGINRFPVYGFEYGLQDLRQCDNFIFGLGDHGLPLIGLEDVDEDELYDFGEWLCQAVCTLAEHLLAIGPQEFERERHILFVNELIAEGDHILKDVFKISTWGTNPVACECTEQLLDHVETPAKIGEYFAYDYVEQEVRIFHKRYDTSEEFAHALEMELRRLADEVAVYEDYMTAESPAIHNVLQHYYGAEVRIPEIVSGS